MQYEIPIDISQILLTLEQAGFEAFLVGGCVRDFLLHRQPHDWDICTSAMPEKILELFPGSLPTGIAHGTVTVYSGSLSAEVTTYRSEGAYSDHRRPDQVTFIRDLRGDLQRRDFTMNAIAMAHDGSLSDPFDGLRDIEAHRIRCVGNPDERFTEDALRMFRALRFSAQLGFALDASLLSSLECKASLSRFLAVERIESELTKTLLSPAPETAAHFFSSGLMKRFQACSAPDDWQFSCPHTVEKAVGYTALCHALLQSGQIIDARGFLQALRMDKASIETVLHCLSILSSPPEDQISMLHALFLHGEPAVCCVLPFLPELSPCYEKIKEAGIAWSVAQLAISGEDVLNAGYSGKEVGMVLQLLLFHVMERPENNTHSRLLALLARLPQPGKM